jgi:hydroxymethylpyrimidine/phosphomethylpyrimidine kinase
VKTALSIAGSDPTGGAGLQADLKVFKAVGVLGLSVTAAITAQNTREVREVFPVYSECLREQLDALLDDITPGAVKTGMLYSRSAVDVVADCMRNRRLKNLVIDPVTVSTSGMSLVEDGMIDRMKQELFPLAEVVTPNIYEASLLTSKMIESPADMQEAAKALLDMGPKAVIITGGHLEGLITDMFYDGSELQRFHGKKVEGSFHGTGCAFSAAVAGLLAYGSSPVEAAARARELVQESISRSIRPGGGMHLLDF